MINYMGADKDKIDRYWRHPPREIMQKVGTELFRAALPRICENIDNDIWIRSAERKMLNLEKMGYACIVITDVQFPNEVDFIKKMNGIIWNVERKPNADNLGEAHCHRSEKLDLGDNCDFAFSNDGTIDGLYDCEMKKSLPDVSPCEL